jgi:hypothetical protein
VGRHPRRGRELLRRPGPAALAAFLPKQKNTDGNIATAKQGQDGNTWKVQ